MIEHVQMDVLDWAKTYTGPKFHAMLGDPPYHLVTPRFEKTGGADRKQGPGPYGRTGGGFMGKSWDGGDIAFRAETWAALGEHLLPGAFCMAFSGARTYHRMACAIEDAGFILHSMIGWVYGSGFPKATRIDTQVDRAAGAERELVERIRPDGKGPGQKLGTFTAKGHPALMYDDPATPLAATWAGHRYGLQALKPALEPICVFQKPYAGRPVDSITATGAGALWIEGGRIACGDTLARLNKPGDNGWKNSSGGPNNAALHGEPAGRWPSNLILDPIAAQALGQHSGITKSSGGRSGHTAAYGGGYQQEYYGDMKPGLGDVGDVSRYFQQCDWALEEAEPFYYCAKASRRERDAGLGGMPEYHVGTYAQDEWSRQHMGNTPDAKRAPVHCNHPTVKPLSLARYLATLLLPPAEYAPRRILVPFAGVASEMIGAMQAGWEDILGIEMEEEYVEMGKARMKYWQTRQLELGVK